MVEARAELTNKDGKDFKMDFCTVMEYGNFKAIRVAEYGNDINSSNCYLAKCIGACPKHVVYV